MHPNYEDYADEHIVEPKQYSNNDAFKAHHYPVTCHPLNPACMSYCPLLFRLASATHAINKRAASLIVLSTDPEAACRPSGENATNWTQPLRPFSVCVHAPDSQSQTLIVLSPDPEAICRPSGENTTDQTEPL